MVQIEETPEIERLLTERDLRDHKYAELLESWADCRPLTDKSKPSPKAVADMFDTAQHMGDPGHIAATIELKP